MDYFPDSLLLVVRKNSIPAFFDSAEGKLLAAIKDNDNHATLNIVGNTGTPFFGVHSGEGVNTVDMGNASQLDAASNKGGMNSGDLLAHEAMDAYYSLSMGALDADLEAAELFPGLQPPMVPPEDLKNGSMAVGQMYVQNISNLSGSERITIRYVTPIPISDLQARTPQEVVQKTGGARVTGVTFVPPPKQQ